MPFFFKLGPPPPEAPPIVYDASSSSSPKTLVGAGNTALVDDVVCMLESNYFAEGKRFDLERAVAQKNRMTPKAALILGKSDSEINLAAARAFAPHLSAIDALTICEFYRSPAGQEIAKIQLHIFKTGEIVPASRLSEETKKAYVKFKQSPAYIHWGRVQSNSAEFFGEIEKL